MKKFLLFAIITIACVMRFYKLDTIPALNADEAAIGYNAYSLLLTGKDEHANPWPIHFQSFNDYKPGLYFYLVLPFVKIIGLNIWAVRLPSVLLGVANVLLVYLLAKELIDKKDKLLHQYVPLVSALFLSISPWHIHFSRGGWEVNVSTFFLTLGTYLFLLARKKPWVYILSILSFVASLYTYHSARIIAPLLGLALVVIYRQQVFKKTAVFLLSCVMAFIVTLPLIIDFTGEAGISRAAGVGLFADPGPLSRINEQRGQHEDFQGEVAKFFHNRPVNYGIAFVENWMSHYWGEFLFLSGDEIQRNKVPETGQLHMYDILFVIIGVLLLLRKRAYLIILFWLVIAPLAASLTFQSPHALRAQNMVIPISIISAFGCVFILQRLANYKKIGMFLIGLTIFIMVINVFRYTHMYLIHMPAEYKFSSQYGVKELADFISQNGHKYQKIIITDRYDQPYILMLYYLKYSPQQFQAEHNLTPRDQYGFSTVRRFGKFEFVSIDYDQMRPEYPNSLLVGTDEEIPTEANIIKKIYGTNRHLYFEIVEN